MLDDEDDEETSEENGDCVDIVNGLNIVLAVSLGLEPKSVDDVERSVLFESEPNLKRAVVVVSFLGSFSVRILFGVISDGRLS